MATDVDDFEGREDDDAIRRMIFDIELNQRIRKAKGLRNEHPEPIPIEAFRAEWLAFYSSPNMARSGFIKHRQVLREVAEWAGSTADFTPQLVARWVECLMGRHLRPASIKSMVDHFRTMCDYAVRRGYLKSNPVDARERWLPNNYTGRPAPPSPGRLGKADAANLVAYLLARTHTWEGHRLFALVATGLYTGLRKSELLKLRVDAWNAIDRTIECNRVGFGWGATRVSPKLGEIIDDWVPRAACDWMFPGVRRLGPWVGGPYGERPQDQLKAAGAAVGLARLTFEGLREYWDWCYGAVNLGEALRERAPAKAPIPEVVAFDKDGFPVIRGIRKDAITAKTRRIIDYLIAAGPEGVTWAELGAATSRGCWHTLDALKKSDPDWDSAILFPGQGKKGVRIAES